MVTIEDLIALDEAIAQAEGWLSFAEWYAYQETISGQWDQFYREVGLL